MTDRIEPQVEELWEEFHGLVNMSSEELRRWLLTEVSGENAFADDPDRLLPELGEHVLKILGKRKGDLTGADTEVMRRVVDQVRGRLGSPPRDGVSNDGWRRALMTLGHDPLKPDVHGSEDTR